MELPDGLNKYDVIRARTVLRKIDELFEILTRTTGEEYQYSTKPTKAKKPTRVSDGSVKETTNDGPSPE